jgi:hypothetical protein
VTLQNIAQTVKGSPGEDAPPAFAASATTSTRPTSASGSTQPTPPGSETNWLDDPETFKFLQSLGLMNPVASDAGMMPTTGIDMNTGASNNPFQPGMSYEATWDPMSSFANTFSMGLDALDGTD